MQNKAKRIKVTLTKLDTYLDITYYKQEIEYWDKDKELVQQMASFNLGYILLNLFSKFDNLGQELEVEIKVKNNPSAGLLLQQASGQVESKQGKLKASRDLTSSEKEAKKLKEYLKVYNCWVG